MTHLLGSWHGNMPQVCGRSPLVWWLMAPCRRTLDHPGLQSDNHRNPPGSRSQTFSKYWRRDEKVRWFNSTSTGVRHILYIISDFLRTCTPCLRVQRLFDLYSIYNVTSFQVLHLVSFLGFYLWLHRWKGWKRLVIWLCYFIKQTEYFVTGVVVEDKGKICI